GSEKGGTEGELGTWRAGDVAEVVSQQVGRALVRLERDRARLRGHGIADHRTEVRQQAPDRVGQVARVPRPDVEQLDRVRNRRRAVSPQDSQFRGAQPRCRFRHYQYPLSTLPSRSGSGRSKSRRIQLFRGPPDPAGRDRRPGLSAYGSPATYNTIRSPGNGIPLRERNAWKIVPGFLHPGKCPHE